MSIGTFGAFTQARLAIYAAQTGISVTGNNISNVNTPGYTRQRLNQVSLYTAGSDRYYAAGDIRTGQGALVKSLSQIRDPYLDIRFRAENHKVGYYDAFTSGLNSIQSVLDETGKGDASKGEDGFGILGLDFSKLAEALLNINDQTGHQEYDDSVRGVAQSLVTKLHSYAGKLEQIRENTIIEFNENIDAVNGCLKSIREYNEEIRKCEIYGDPALELRDMRNMQIDQLSNLIPINVVYDMETVSPGLQVERLSIYLDNNNPDKSVDTDESILVHGVFSAQIVVGKPELNDLAKYKADDIKDNTKITDDELDDLREIAKEQFGLSDADAAALTRDNLADYATQGAYLKREVDKDGKETVSVTDDIREANVLTDEDNPNYDIMITELRNKQDEIDVLSKAYATEVIPQTDLTTLIGEIMGADKGLGDLKFNNADMAVLRQDGTQAGLAEGDEVVYIITRKLDAGGKPEDPTAYTYYSQKFERKVTKPVALDDNDLGGRIQAQRELLTEEGIFIDQDVIAGIDENAAGKRGIGYYQKVLDLLANQFANTLNEANQGFLHDKDGNYMAPVLDANGEPVLDDDGYRKGELVTIDVTRNGNTEKVPVNKNWDSMETDAQDAIAASFGFADAKDMLDQGVTGKQALDAFMKGQTWDTTKKAFIPANKDDVFDKDGNLVEEGWAGQNGKPKGIFVGGPLFSNANDSDDTTGITASNINVSAMWTKNGNACTLWKEDSTLVRSFECIDGTVEVATGKSDNLNHLKYLVAEKKVDFTPNQLDTCPNASDEVYFKGTFFEMWNDIGGTLGKDQKEAEDMLDTYYQSALSIDMDRDSVSSVDFNDEAMNLMMYAKSYNAACRLMTTIDSVLDKLINNTGMTT